MPYGIIKVDQVTFTNAGVDQTISVSGIVASISGNITATGTISGNVIRGGTTVSGATVTGTAGQFGTITGNTAGFTTVTGTTITGTTLTVASGTFTGNSTAAAFIPTGSTVPTNGVYLPSANNVAISTNGAGRLFITSAGLIGIGQSSPGSALDVAGEIRIYPTSGAANLRFGSGGAEKGKVAIDSSSNYIVETAGSERLRITSAGLVGVGNSSPGSYNASSDDLVIGDHVGAHGVTICSQNNSSGYIMFADGTTGAQTYAGQITYDHTNNRLTLGTNDGTTGLTIDSSQRVGIGTSSPSSLLHVQGSASNIFRVTTTDTGASNILSINNNDNFNYGIIGVISGNGTAGGDVFGAGYTSVLTSDFTPVINWTSQGRVGIGTTNPIELLTVASGTDRVGVNVSGTVSTLLIGNSNPATSCSSISFDRGDGSLRFNNGVTGSITERARIDSSGRLLVGTSTASGTNTLFESSSTTANAANVALVKRNSGTADQAGQQLHFYNFGPANTARAAGTEVGSMRFYGSQPTSGAAQEMASITCAADLLQTGSSTSGRLVFSTTADGASSPTERMRILNDGNILIGTTNTATGARIYCSTASNASSIYTECTNASQTTSVLSVVAARNTTNGSYKAIEYYNSGAGATRFFVSDNGDARNANGVFGAISDIKLKENIVDANSQWDDIKALRVRNYNLKSDQTHRQIGVVAQELELVSPGLVADLPDYDRDGNDLGTVTKAVNYSVLYMKAVKALQEAMERIEQLETEKTEQQTVLDNLLARVAVLEAA